MGTKLEATSAELDRISRALKKEPAGLLDEARKKTKYRRPKGAGRREKKKAEKTGKEHAPEVTRKLGLPDDNPLDTPLIRAKNTRIGQTKARKVDDPSGPPALGSKNVQRPAQPRTPVTPAPSAPLRAPTPPAPPPRPEPEVKKPEREIAGIKPVSATSQRPKVADTPATTVKVEKPSTSQRRTAVGVPPTTVKPSFLDRIMRLPRFLRGKKPPQDQNQPPSPKPPTRSGMDRLKAVLKRFASFFGGRKKLMDDIFVPRTLLAMQITEERNETTFKPCKQRAMVSTAHLRHSIPKPWFVKPDEENPTYPVRTDCRASLAALGRAIQHDMGNPDEDIVGEVLKRVNATTGQTRGRLRLRLWGTGRGGRRMETFRGPPGKAKRTDTLAKKLGISKKDASKLHGVSTGRADNQKHTPPYSPPGGSKGPAGNREVPRHPLAHAKPPTKETTKKTKRQERREAHKIGRGQAKIGR